MAGDAVRAESAQAPGLRWADRRATNYEEPVLTTGPYDETIRPNLTVVQDDANAADMVDEATADWGSALRVSGYDRITLLLDHIAGTTTSAVHVAMQVSYSEKAPDAEWFDYYADEASDGVLVRKVWDLTTAVDAKVAFEVPTEGVAVRFKVWADGADRSDSRATLYARRIMDAL